MSPQLASVTAAGQRAVAGKAAPWTLASADWFTAAERLRGLFASLVNGEADGVALVPSASYGIAIAAANVEVRRGQDIVLLDQEFPSNVYAWRDLVVRRHARIHTVRRGSGESWTDAVLAAIGADTAVVAIPNCHWTDGSLVDLGRIALAARAVGAALVVDASQSLGARALDVAVLQPDFLVTVGYKWLLGPYGLGYLYVAPRWRDAGRPIEQSWLARAGAEDFARLREYTDAYRPGARRFDMGEFPQFVLAPMAIAALEQVAGWGVDRIHRTLAALTAAAAAGAEAVGAHAPPAGQRAGHMVGIRPAGGVTQGLLEAFARARVYVGIRGESIRVAPHLYNDEAGMTRFLDAMRRGAAA